MIKSRQEQTRPEIKTGLEEMTTVRQPRKVGSHTARNGGLSRRDGGLQTEDTIKNRVENILASVDQQLKEKVKERKLGLQTVMTSLNMQTKSLSKMIKECRDGSP
jgi:hypothetical protein